MIKNPKFMELLVSEKILAAEDVQSLLDQYAEDAFAILDRLLRERVAEKDLLGKLWGDSINVAYVDLKKTLFKSHIVGKLSEKLARKHQAIPLYEFGNTVTVVASNPMNKKMLKVIEEAVGAPIHALFSFPDDINHAIDVQYKASFTLEKYVEKLPEWVVIADPDQYGAEELDKAASEKAVMNFAHALMVIAAKDRATDIHLEYQEKYVVIRFRIDGVLQERYTMDRALFHPLSLRLKQLAGLDLAERRRPQSGKIGINMGKRPVEFLFSAVPTVYGEKIVLKILTQGRSGDIPDLTEVNLSKANLAAVTSAADRRSGIFLVGGPPGSGKTTLLYVMLKRISAPEINILTIEETVRYKLNSVIQTQTDPMSHFDYGAALSAFQHQDPDVILLGRIHDAETARLAVRSALSGQLVLSAMVARNAVQLISRLIELGVEASLAASALIGVMAQQLVRRVCEYCKESYLLTADEADKYFIRENDASVRFYQGKGCPECQGAGYLERVALQEVLMIDPDVSALIARGASAFEILEAAGRNGFRSMHYDGMKKALRGLTGVEELERAGVH